MKKLLAAAAFATATSLAMAATGNFEVKAFENSTSETGIGLSTFNLLPGYTFSITVDPADLWNAGALPRWSNASGLTSNLTYSASTDSQVSTWYGGSLADGTLIGQDFGTHTQGGLIAPFGTLVGQIGSGNFFVIGTSFSGTASSAGMLKLFYFDSNNWDNAGSIMAQVTAVPEPETYAMLLAGLGIVGAMARRRKQGMSAA